MTGPIIQVDSGAFGRNIFVHVSKTVHFVKGVEEVWAGFLRKQPAEGTEATSAP